jgi:hypothetical protein
MAERRPYRVVESERFTYEAEQAFGDFWAWEKLKNDLDLALANRPEVFPLIFGTSVRAVAVKTDPPHAIYYRVDPNCEEVIYEAVF